MVPRKPLEILAEEASELSAQMEAKRSSKRTRNTRTVIRTWHHVEAAGTPCPACIGMKLHQQTPDFFLTFVAKRKLSNLDDTQMDTVLTICSIAQYMFLVQHHRGNTLMAAVTHRNPRYSRHRGGEVPRFHRCLRGRKLLTPSGKRKALPLNVWLSIAAKLGLAGRRRMGAFLLVMLCSYAQPSELLPMRARQLVPPTSSVTSSWSLLIASQEHGQCTKTNLTDVSILLDWLDGKGRVHSADRRQKKLLFCR